jgi:hypothetical protein
MMGAVAWWVLGVAAASAVVAGALVVRHRRRVRAAARTPDVDLVAAEAAQHDDDREFDRIVGDLLRSDPSFADSASRLARHDDAGPSL